MDYTVIDVRDRSEFRQWLEKNHDTAKECWIYSSVSEPKNGELLYLDAVEEALCFGWIDSTKKKTEDGRVVQRFSPRRSSKWTELNKERCRRLERLGLMTDAGRRVMPDLDEPFVIDDDIIQELKDNPPAWENLQSFPDAYVRIRIYNIQSYRGLPEFRSRLDKFIENSKKGKMYGSWDDGGRLS